MNTNEKIIPKLEISNVHNYGIYNCDFHNYVNIYMIVANQHIISKEGQKCLCYNRNLLTTLTNWNSS